jgi:hypothetical protein
VSEGPRCSLSRKVSHGTTKVTPLFPFIQIQIDLVSIQFHVHHAILALLMVIVIFWLPMMDFVAQMLDLYQLTWF